MTATNQGPLSGIRVVELGTHMAVPNVTRAMADCGADVIKVEGTMGEEWRILGRNYGVPHSDEENPFFTAQNANKRFIALDLKSERGKEVLLKLIGEADVFISNVRLKSIEKLGLGYDELKARFPALIYCHFTGFGYQGPDADRPGFDTAAFWARSGALSDWVEKGEVPIKPSPGFGDAATANMMLSGVLMALLGRNHTGKGTLVSASLYGSALWYSSSALMLSHYGVDTRKSRYEPANPLANFYQCADGNWVVITIINYDANKDRFLRVMGMEDCIGRAPFDSFAHVKEHMREVVEALNRRFMTKTRDEWAEIFESADVVYEKLLHYSEVTKDPQAWANGYLQEVEFKSGGKAILPRFPLLFSEYAVKAITPTNDVGHDTQEILAELGYDAETTGAMRKERAVR